jgi:signal transduction histidine kinase
VYLDNLKVDDRYLDISSGIELKSRENDLVFQFTIITTSSEGLEYAYKLQGYDPDWIEGSTDRQVRYTSLPPNGYQFILKAGKKNGIWSEPISSPSILIRQPYSQSWWFRVLALFVSLGILYAIAAFRSSRRYSRHLEREVAARLHQIQSLNRDLRALNEDLEVRVQERTAELRAAQKDLVESAHHAGMAEIANSILHNVGNILNSVSTTGYIIQQAIHSLKIKSFLRANQILQDRRVFFAQPVQEDPKGEELINFYLHLGDWFQGKQHELTENVTLLVEKINTIKEVVAQHHNYASGVYQKELIDPGEILDIALDIVADMPVPDHIELRVDRQPVPPIELQKTKVVHTVVNLLKNAVEAIEAKGDASGKIQVSLGVDDQTAFFTVIDTGIGIKPKHMRRIFRHGFTTKKDGNGFGLHSCATTMQELGGSIRVHSEGPDKGARFELVFPLTPARAGTPRKDSIEV